MLVGRVLMIGTAVGFLQLGRVITAKAALEPKELRYNNLEQVSLSAGLVRRLGASLR
jgi:hypothetical protein